MARILPEAVLHAAVFVIARFTFVLGLGVGLVVKTTACTLLLVLVRPLPSPMSSGLWLPVGVAARRSGVTSKMMSIIRVRKETQGHSCVANLGARPAASYLSQIRNPRHRHALGRKGDNYQEPV